MSGRSGGKWSARMLPDDGIKHSRRRKRGDAYIVSQETMETIVQTLRCPDPVAQQRLTREIVDRMGERRGQG